MLNRTLLANTNRLNHGTRSLDLISSGVTGNLTLGFAHVDFAAAVRVGIPAYPGLPPIQPPMPGGDDPLEPEMPRRSGSSPESRQRHQRWQDRDSKPGSRLATKAQRHAMVRGLTASGPPRSADADPSDPKAPTPRTPLDDRCRPGRTGSRAARVVVVPVAAS